MRELSSKEYRVAPHRSSYAQSLHCHGNYDTAFNIIISSASNGMDDI